MKTKKKLKKGWIIALGVLLVFVLLFVGGFSFYQFNLQAVSSSSAQKEVTIDKGTSSKKIAQLLKENNLIRNEFVFLAYLKLHHVTDLKFGTYLFQEDMGVEKIVSALQNGSDYDPNALMITFQEGLNMRQIATIIAEHTNNTYEAVLEKANDMEYIAQLQEKYWFITDEVKQDAIFYKLEGYLFPDTYELASKDVSVEYIFQKMLDQMAKQLEPYRDYDYSTLSIHERLTLASMVEKESSIASDRSKMAAVFLNRMSLGMSLGSDVTARYANKIDDKNQRLTESQLQLKSPYNTRLLDGSMNGKLPIGPIAMVSSSSIDAAFHPDSHSYLYFISNIQTSETFFYENYSDFLAKKEELQEVNQGF